MSDFGPLWTASGAAVVVLARETWAWLKTRRSPEELAAKNRELAAKDKTVALLEAELARTKRELWESERDAEALRQRLEEWTDRTVGVAARMRMDSQIDETEFEADLPTKVRERLERVAPKNRSVHPGPAAPGKHQLAPGAGRLDYDALDVGNITPTALAPPMGSRSGKPKR